MTDFLLLEQIQRMIKEIPKPRLLFRKGITVGGFFRPYMSLSDYTKAQIFSFTGVITPVKVRFSAMLGDDGTADTVRNIKRMETSFMSAQGEYDMVCHSIPVQFINDKDKLMELFNIFYMRKRFDGINTEAFWRFVTENHEALNAAVHMYSHEGLSDNYTDIRWHSVNTAIWYNNHGEEWLVRYKWMPVHETNNTESCSDNMMSRNEAEFIAGFDPHRAHNELINSIAAGKYPMFELYIQMMSPEHISDRAVSDHTLIWDENKAPFMSVGIMMLDKTEDENTVISGKNGISCGNTVEGIRLCRNELVDIIEYMHRVEAMERGMIK